MNGYDHRLLKYKLVDQASRTFSEKLNIDAESKHYSAGYLLGTHDGIRSAAEACVSICISTGDYTAAKLIRTQFGIEDE